MNTEEQTLIDGLFSRLRQAEDPAQPRDAQAQARIEEHLRQQPAAGYYMTQAILVQEAALKQLDEQNKRLQAELQQARSQAPQSGNGGGFLSSIFGSSSRSPAPAPQAQPNNPPPAGGGWRDQGPQGAGQPQASGFAGASAAPAAARSGAGSFLGGAMQTAAGVAGGVLLAQGISSLFGHGAQPQEVVEVIQEPPSNTSDHGGWNDQGNQQVADNGNYGNDQGGFSDTDYGSDDGGGFSDDDTFI